MLIGTLKRSIPIKALLSAAVYFILLSSCEKDGRRDPCDVLPLDSCQVDTCIADTCGIDTCVGDTCSTDTTPGPGTFEVFLGTSGSETVRSADITSDGGCIITGTYTNTAAEGFSAFLMRVSPSGEMLWYKHYRKDIGPFDSYAQGSDVKQLQDGGFIMAGVTNSALGNNDFYLVRTDPEGNVIWEKNLDLTPYDGLVTVDNAPDGGFFCTGIGDDERFVIKYNVNGDTVWTRRIAVYPANAIETFDGGYLVAGFASLIKLDAAGGIVFQKEIQLTSPQSSLVIGSIRSAPNNHYLISGTISEDNFITANIYLTLVNEVIDTVWTKRIQFTGNEGGNSAIVRSGGGYVMPSNLGGGIGSPAGAIGMDGQRNLVWTRSYKVGSLWLCWELPDEKLLFVGHSSNYGHGKSDAYVIKTDSLGRIN